MSVYSYILKNAWLFVTLAFACLIACFLDIPVFWDMYGQVKTADFYLQTYFYELCPNGNGFTDNGYFPLYPVYLALLCKLLGFQLWVVHLSVLPFIAGMLYQLQVFSRRFLSERKTALVLCLSLLHPALEAQSIYFSSEIAFVFLALCLLNNLIDKHGSYIVLSATALCLLNFRALPWVSLLFLYEVFGKKQKSAWYLILPLFFSLAWMAFHFLHYGWFFVNPENEEHRTLLGIKGMAGNFFWCLLKLSDYATIIVLIFTGMLCYQEKKIREPQLYFLLAILATISFLIPLSNPISNRYFLFCYVLSLPVFVHSLSGYPRKKKVVFVILYALFLVQSNWVSKPNKYGNAWDCTLQSLSYFDIRKELDAYVMHEKIAPADVAAGFQLYFKDAYYLMNKNPKEYALLSDTEMQDTPFIAESNICNNYSAARLRYLEKNYDLIKTFCKGSLYIKLYKRKERAV